MHEGIDIEKVAIPLKTLKYTMLAGYVYNANYLA